MTKTTPEQILYGNILKLKTWWISYLYLMTDVYLLNDVFENVRDMCLNYYGLDPTYFITLPNYSWNAFYHWDDWTWIKRRNDTVLL